MVPVWRCFLGIYPDKLRKISVVETDDMSEMWNKYLSYSSQMKYY